MLRTSVSKIVQVSITVRVYRPSTSTTYWDTESINSIVTILTDLWSTLCREHELKYDADVTDDIAVDMCEYIRVFTILYLYIYVRMYVPMFFVRSCV